MEVKKKVKDFRLYIINNFRNRFKFTFKMSGSNKLILVADGRVFSEEW